MRITCKALVALVATCVLSAQPIVSLTETDARKAWADSSARKLRERLSSEVPLSELGDWPLAVEGTLFMLFRKTELHRGRLSVRFVRSDSIVADVYPDATVVLSTGLLDHIDVVLFDRMASSARRVRSLEREREEALLPFLAPLAAETALDFGFATSAPSLGSAKDKRNAAHPAVPDRFLVDRVTVAMLALAGYETKPYIRFLADLSRAGVSPALRDWAARFPPAPSRLASLESSREAVSRLSTELVSLASAASTGADTRDILASSEAVASIAGDIPYLARLRALAFHRAWLSTVPTETTVFLTHLPVASELDRSAEAYAANASRMTGVSAESLAAKLSRAYMTASPVPGDARTFELALESYARAREAPVDAALDSSYARLLAFSPTVEARKEALGIALSAGEAEGDADSPIARANLAALLFYSGSDRARARALAGRFALPSAKGAAADMAVKAKASVSSDATSDAVTGLVRVGYPCDEREISVNLAVMMKASGEAKEADEYLARIRVLYADTRSIPSVTRASFRRLVPGDTVDSLVTFWGKPAGISYSYYSEWWEYPSLKARVLVAKDADGGEIVRHVALGTGSPVSPGGDVRVGDPLADFENEFGQPSYRVADSLAYLPGGSRLVAFAPYGTIRSISGSY